LCTLAVGLVISGCGDEEGDGNKFAGGDGGSDASADGGSAEDDGASGSATNSGGGDDDDDDGDDGPKFDVGSGMTGGDDGGSPTGCEKIDFLFVIDNSGSMSPHQQNLVNNFPKFIDTIAAEVQGKDYHVMVVDSDACPSMSGGCTPSSCEEELGAGQVRSCPNIDPTKRFMTSAQSLTEIKDGFSCAALVGDQGSANELPMSAMVEVLTSQNDAGGCNPAFIRDDAILVVTIISDDHIGWFGEDDVKIGNPQAWRQAVMDKKVYDENVVVLGLFSLLSDQSCIGFGPQEATKFVEFVQLFGARGLMGSVCEPDYNAFFQMAVDQIDKSCDEYVPPAG